MTVQENPTGYNFTILSEDVSTQDLFEDRTHERVSENLFAIIKESQKGVTIGLEGSWGSGKSTVIKLLKDKLTRDKDNKTLFFLFDAWAHDGDPLRRIFLESLIREIDSEEQDNELKIIKDKITGRRKTVEVTSKKSTSRLGKYISFSALLIPLGSALLGKVNYDGINFSLSEDPYYLFIFGLLLCLSPLAVLGYWFFQGDRDIKDNISWEFFSTESTESYTQDITEDGERTSIEFEDYFKCIIQTSMRKKLIDKCIIVVDNLDRVDPEHAKNIWSTLQTFFQKRSYGECGNSWSDNLWFVIPFDREGFSKIWRENQESNEVSQSFLKKCFQLIAEVPQPVMSGWYRYAEKCVEEALHKWPEEERRAALSNYIRYTSRLEVSPTPRDIKVFANQIGLLGAMWGGEVSIEAMCLYALFKETFTTNQLRRDLVANQLPKGYQTDGERSDICAELAGLLFGVKKQKGLQLLLGPEIKAALNAGDGKTITSLLDDHGSAFWIAYEASKNQWMPTDSHTDEYKISFTKAIHDGLLNNKSRIKNELKQLTDVWMSSFDKWDLASFDYSTAMEDLLELCPNKDYVKKLIFQYVTKKITSTVDQIGSEKFPEKELKNLKKLEAFLGKNDVPLKRYKYNKLDLPSWNSWLDFSGRNEIKFETVLPRDNTITQLADTAQFNAPNYNLKALATLSDTYDIYSNCPEWEAVSDNIVAWANMANRDYQSNEIYELMIKLIVGENEKISSKLKLCVMQPAFWQSGVHSPVEGMLSLAILCALAFENKLQSNPNTGGNVKSFWGSEQSTEVAGAIFKRLAAIKKLGVIWLLAIDKSNLLAIQIIRDYKESELYESSLGVNYLDDFAWATSTELNEIATQLVKLGAFNKNKENMKDSQRIFHKVLYLFSQIDSSDVISFVNSEILNVSKEDWSECLSDGSYLLRLLKPKNHKFSEAFEDFLVNVVSKSDAPKMHEWVLENFDKLMDKATDVDTVLLPKVISSYFKTETDYLASVEFEKIKKYFSKHMDSVVPNLYMLRLNKWIDNGVNDRINWLLDQNIKIPELPLEGLVDRVRLNLNSDEESICQLAERINLKFGLNLVKKENDGSGDD